MTAEKAKHPKDTEEKETEALTFHCQNCQKDKPFEEMRVITRFFPLMVVCRDCEKEIR